MFGLGRPRALEGPDHALSALLGYPEIVARAQGKTLRAIAEAIAGP